jgi:type II restriction enzyme
LKARHPSNNNIQAKIRQQLQFLRDRNIIDFIGHGKYSMKIEET